MSNKKEIWKSFTIDGRKPKVPYVISNHGRFGVLPKGSKSVEIRTFKPTAGSYRFNTRQGGKNKAVFLTREVALAFLKKPSKKHTFIIHKDHDYLNNHADNLKWALSEEHRKHTTFSPNSVLARQKKAITKSAHASVLNEKSVRALKTMIWDPKRKLSYKQLAEKFGVSEMQIYRIKTWQYWYHVKVENEPLNIKYKQNLANVAYQEKLATKKMAKNGKATKNVHQANKTTTNTPKKKFPLKRKK